MKRIVNIVIAMFFLFNTGFAFPDVDKNHWGYEAINSMQKRGIVSGFYDNTFKPDENITKEQLATILTNSFDFTGNYAYNFEDVNESRWSHPYIKATWMYFTNVRKGYKYYFEPDMPITREEAAKTVVRALDIDTTEVDLSVLNQFSDRNEFFSEYTKADEIYIAFAVEHGIMKGKGGYFAPKDTLTRAEIAAIMYNILGEEDIVLKYSDFDLLDYMPQNENYMISPFSIKMAMMMAANGADGETRQEILNAFGIESIDEYNEFSKDIIKKYTSNEKVKLNVANSIWLNNDREALAKFDDDFTKVIEDYFDGTTNEVNSSNAVKLINDWCSVKTNGKINEIISSPDFLAALVNAIYFKGSWASQFKEVNTFIDNFTTHDGTNIEKSFMYQKGRFDYYEDESIQMVEMPYEDINTSMYIVLSKNDGKIDINNAISNMTHTMVNIKLPKFKVEYNQELSGILKEMGIDKAFLPSYAEFNSKMFDNILDNVCISSVLHKTFIEVDENGTEAAAITAILMRTTSVKPEYEVKEFNADRPFIYFIRDNESGAILFMGQIVE